MIKDKDGNNYYKLALHQHTTLSDGKKTPEEVAKEYKAAGYDAVAFTDHWYYGGEQQIDGVKIISGCEYNLGVSDTVEGVMHIVGLGMKKDPKVAREASRQQVVDAIRREGGIAVLAHPAWSLNTVEDLEALEGITATEIYNAVSEVGESMRAYSDYFVDLAANRGLFPVLLATDDAHYYKGGDNCRGFVMVKAENLDTGSIIDAIKRGDLYASQGPELYVRREGKKFIIDTNPVSVIGICSSMSWSKGRVLRGEGLTHFEYLANEERWLRVEVIDKEGRHAWSNIFVP